MFRKHLAAGLLSFGMLAVAAPAHAGDVSISIGISQSAHGYAPGVRYVDHRDRHDYRHTLSPREIRRMLRRDGFSHIEFLDTEGRTYTARADDHRGRPVLVRVSARSGEVSSVSRLGRGRGGHGDRPRCWLPEGCR
jgi:hypothetical protein